MSEHKVWPHEPSTRSLSGHAKKHSPYAETNVPLKERLVGAAVIAAIGAVALFVGGDEKKSSGNGAELPAIHCAGEQTVTVARDQRLADIAKEKVDMGPDVYTRSVVKRIQNTNDLPQGTPLSGAILTLPTECANAG